MAASFRFSQIPGSSNSSLLITRENVELFWDASIDLADSLSRAEQSLVTIDLDTSPTGNFTLTDSGVAAGTFIGDKLTVLVKGAGGSEVITLGTGFTGAGLTMSSVAVLEFIAGGSTWILVSKITE